MEPQVTETMTAPLPETAAGCLSDAGFGLIRNLAAGKSALALGPGLGTEAPTRRLVRRVLTEIPIPLVLDADGLNCLEGDTDVLRSRKAPLILTPHPGEMARLTGTDTRTVQEDRLLAARDFAVRHRVVLVLKGYRTLTALPDGRVIVCPTGNPGMASGGMGDTLTGIIGGLLAQGFSPENAARAGVHVHGLCGDTLARTRGGFGFTASHLVELLPETFQGLLQ
jgi:NAD(P)H-hydrate epimerase